jgi:CheY-like chemotaxis protein
LIVEDDAPTRQVIDTIARSAGFLAIDEASLASEAVQLATFRPPVAIVVDVHLMGMSGIAAIPSLRQAAPDASIVIWTADDDALPGGVPDGVWAVVPKSDPERLERVLVQLAGAALSGTAVQETTSSQRQLGDVISRLLDNANLSN